MISTDLKTVFVECPLGTTEAARGETERRIEAKLPEGWRCVALNGEKLAAPDAALDLHDTACSPFIPIGNDWSARVGKASGLRVTIPADGSDREGSVEVRIDGAWVGAEVQRFDLGGQHGSTWGRLCAEKQVVGWGLRPADDREEQTRPSLTPDERTDLRGAARTGMLAPKHMPLLFRLADEHDEANDGTTAECLREAARLAQAIGGTGSPR